MLSLLPPYLQLITSIIGFESDQHKAVAELTECADSKVPKAAEATLLLAALSHFFLDDVEKSKELLNQMTSEYPSVHSSYHLTK